MLYRHLATENASSVPLPLMKDLIQCRFVVELKFNTLKNTFYDKDYLLHRFIHPFWSEYICS
jgi:hypothetical protein